MIDFTDEMDRAASALGKKMSPIGLTETNRKSTPWRLEPLGNGAVLVGLLRQEPPWSDGR